MSNDLPAFHRPPVVEVALSVAFEPMPQVSPLIGLFWDRYYRDDLPHLEQVAPGEPQVERFDALPLRGPQVRFELLESAPPSRFWFSDQSGRSLLQLQQNWIARNWRSQGDGQKYPRYPSIRGPFAGDLENLRTFVVDNGLAEPKPIQCEVVYVNHIVAGEAWTDWQDLSTVMRSWSNETTDGFLPRIEEASYNARYLITHEDRPAGRLHVDVKPGVRKSDNAHLIVFTLTARGAPISPDDDAGLLAFHDIGHEWIVRAFTDLTTERMHEAWGRYR